MERPEPDVDGCADAHLRLATTVAGMSDLEARHPSLLPGWTRGHVVNHLARNAEAMVRRVEAAKQGEMIEQYPGGVAGRAAEIEAGADRCANDLIADVVDWSDRLDGCFVTLDDDGWALPVRSLQGEVHPVARLPFRRWREVEVHLVDLGLGTGPGDWSEAFVDRALPSLLASVEHRTDRRMLTAWLLGRGTPPDLEPWG
jgi:maleylpyruvate isomerase